MGRQTGDQSQLFYLFNLEGRIPAGHLLRRINPIVTRLLAGMREKLALLGFFDPARKRPLPRFPRRLALVTSSLALLHQQSQKLRHVRVWWWRWHITGSTRVAAGVPRHPEVMA